MSTISLTQVSPSRTRPRSLSLRVIAAEAPLLNVPVEIGFQILEFGLIHTAFRTLASVNKAFAALVARLLYRNVVIDSVETLSLFHRTVKSKSAEFLDEHVKTLTVTIEPHVFTQKSRIQLEEVIASCPGLRAVSVMRPAVLALSHRASPSEITIQAFDALHPFEWRRPHSGAGLSTSLTHLKIAEPGDTWQSPLSILEFFGAAPHLTHLCLARRMDANADNDQIFVDELRSLLASRPALKMIVVRVFPTQWPRYFDRSVLAESSTIWMALSEVAEEDKRLLLVPAGLEGKCDGDNSWADVPTTHKNLIRQSGFWDRCRLELESRNAERS
ncbi:hypothetical protein FB45DRAFT_894168 [Roridomyces roridus]|uniref:Uncharacterized protein n=1 Tax=Roridomyces roridus TaxID=1738132 RepID=A0AAD7G0D7_9AGAR|nr:hypothetical protein FB45DRAFT_894168 [Roridomyces roridus]